MKDLLTDITGLVGFAAISVGIGMVELWAGIVVGGACLVYVSKNMAARK